MTKVIIYYHNNKEMDKILSLIKERAIYIADSKGLSKQLFCSQIGLTTGNFRGEAKKTSLNSDTIEKILSLFPDVNIEWLISGKGQPYKTHEQMPGESQHLSKEVLDIISSQQDIIKSQQRVIEDLIKEQKKDVVGDAGCADVG